MTRAQQQQYRVLRQDGIAPAYAKQLATAKPLPDALDGWLGDAPTTWHVGPFTLRAECHAEEAPDLSWLGAFSDRWQPGAIDRVAAGVANRGERRYFVPSQCRGTHAEQRADWRRLEDYGRGWEMVTVAVSVTYRGAEVASLAYGNIESDSGRYLAETAADLAAEALLDARRWVASVRGAA